MLLLGGFAIAAALSKHFIAKQLAISVMSRVGRQPHNVILAAMFVALIASMFISNVAAPVLTFSIVMWVVGRIAFLAGLAGCSATLLSAIMSNCQ